MQQAGANPKSDAIAQYQFSGHLDHLVHTYQFSGNLTNYGKLTSFQVTCQLWGNLPVNMWFIKYSLNRSNCVLGSPITSCLGFSTSKCPRCLQTYLHSFSLLKAMGGVTFASSSVYIYSTACLGTLYCLALPCTAASLFSCIACRAASLQILWTLHWLVVVCWAQIM